MLQQAQVVAPTLALSVFALGAGIVALIAWPRRGLIARALRISRMTERVWLEDALKQIRQMEEGARPATIEALAGALEVGRAHAMRLVEHLAERGLALSNDGRLSLTPAGREYALRMVRTHRLLERYLADQTGVSPAEWHEEAERREHRLSAADTERLSATLGHPRFDPHGDPIPTSTGELPVRADRPLSAFPEGAAVTVVHLEDEPRETFERMLALGLRPGVRLRLLSCGPQEVRFRFDGQVHAIPRVVADQVSAEPLAGGEPLDERIHGSLAALQPGESAQVVRIAAACQGPARRRLLDLGVVPGTVITVEYASPGGDPVAYRIRGALIALRRTQAELIQVEPVPTARAS